MTHEELKTQLHSYVDMIEDETQLQLLNEAAENYVTAKPDSFDALTEAQMQRLEDSLRQANEGKLIAHEEVMKLSREWLSK